MKLEFLGHHNLLPYELRKLTFDDMLLLIESKREKLKTQMYLDRFRTALIAEAFVGKGNGFKYVMAAWKIDEEVKEITPEQIKALIKRKRETEILRKLKRKNSG